MKTKYELLPPESLEAVAQVLTLGESKHKDNSWLNGGVSWGSQFSGIMRHLWKWWSPFYPDTDEETGLSHLAHAGSRVLMLIAQEHRKIGKDDRV